jgi:hypothetical protein
MKVTVSLVRSNRRRKKMGFEIIVKTTLNNRPVAVDGERRL